MERSAKWCSSCHLGGGFTIEHTWTGVYRRPCAECNPNGFSKYLGKDSLSAADQEAFDQRGGR